MKNLIIILILGISIKSYSQWTQISVPTTSGLNNAFFVDENIGYIVGGGDYYGSPNSTEGIILKTTDSGNTWSIIYSQNNISLNHIFVIGSNIYIYGRDEVSQPLQILSNDNGATWSQSTPSFNTTTMYFSDDIIYVFDFEETTIKKIINNVISNIITDVGVFGVNHNELIYINNLFDTIYKSSDYGLNWQELQTYPNGFGGNQSTNAVIKPFNDKIIIHHTYPNHTIFSNDNGTTWEINTDDADTDFTKIINETTIYSVRPNNIAITQNLINWQSLLEDNTQKRNIYFINDSLGFVLGDNGLLYKTENGGILSIIENEDLEKKLKVFPNPTKSILKLEVSQGLQIKKIQLFTIHGKLVKKYKKTIRELKVCDIASGNYILIFKTDKGNITKKIVIE